MILYEFSSDIIYHFVAMWTGSFYLGAFVGPTMAGLLMENYGFKFTSMIFSIFFVVSLIFDIREVARIVL